MSKIYLTIFISDIPVSEAVFHEGKNRQFLKCMIRSIYL